MKVQKMVGSGFLCLILIFTNRTHGFADVKTSWESLYSQGTTSYVSGDLTKAAQMLNSSITSLTENEKSGFDEMRSLAMLLLVYNKTGERTKEARTFKSLLDILPTTQTASLPEDLLRTLREYQLVIANRDNFESSYTLSAVVPQLGTVPENTRKKISVVSTDTKMASYTKGCLKTIGDKWKHQPGDDKIAIDLTLRKDGTVVDAVLVEKSDIADLDKDALELVRSIHYPPLPTGLTSKGIGVFVQFRKFIKDELFR